MASIFCELTVQDQINTDDMPTQVASGSTLRSAVYVASNGGVESRGDFSGGPARTVALLTIFILCSLPACTLIPAVIVPSSEDDSSLEFKAGDAKPVVENGLESELAADEAGARYFIPLRQESTLPKPHRKMTAEVRNEINIYLKGSRRFIRESLERRAQHEDSLGGILESEGIPKDLLNLAIIESGFSNDVKSPAGAAGIWQFMKSTARMYGLKISLIMDQRRHVKLSTLAAARHLKDLYAKYSDWDLALAAYNAGSGKVDSAIRRFKQRDFWKLARSGAFKTETVRHVAKFYAVTHIADNAAAYGISYRGT
ncbi:MAG: lytic transglycosylase domain-containing protein [Deltaproteobacteria bacterium]|nr:lytic transglycosylase domain-containing protein [Deltaproteobacteria bacterium]